MSTDSLSEYLSRFARLHRNFNPKFGHAPHKPILLLAVIYEIERGAITENLVALTPELVAAFRMHWRMLVPENTWTERIAYPFRHLTYEGFWSLVRGGQAAPVEELGNTVSISQMMSLADGGQFAADLWRLLCDPAARVVLRRHLLEEYFGRVGLAREPAASPAVVEAERLVAEARAPFRMGRKRTGVETDAEYLRRTLFPAVVRGLYANACAVCGAEAHDERGNSVVSAVHIVPLDSSGNNDPRNGLALCSNHDTGFRHGWFCLSDDYRVITLPRLRQSGGFVAEGAVLREPVDAACAPAIEAVRWHRRRWQEERAG